MIASDQRTLYVRSSTAAFPRLTSVDLADVRKTLESGPDTARTATLQALIVAAVNGEKELMDSLLMTLIRFVLPLKDKAIKKLLLLLFENIVKVDSDGNLKQEFILVCNSWRNDLQHPNEYVRGATLRFLCHVREPELLEPLVPSVRACLEHAHPYVRRNAIYAAFSIFQHVDFLLPDAPELIESLLLEAKEDDIACQRAAFLMLTQADPARAANYFEVIVDKLGDMDESIQLAGIEFVRQTAKLNCTDDSATRLAKTLLQVVRRSSSAAAKFESACTLIDLADEGANKDTDSVKVCVDALVSLAVKESESNVKLIVLSKLLEDVMPSFPELLETSVMELLRVLGNPDSTVRNLCLKLIASGTTGRTAQEVVQFLRKELSKTDGNVEYRKDLLETLHGLANRFAEVAPEVMNSYLDVLKSGSSAVSESLVAYIKEGLFRYPRLRQVYLSSVIKALPGVADSRAIRNLLWVLGEFCDEPGSISAALASISTCLGELPMLAAEERIEASTKAADQGEVPEASPAHKPHSARGPRVLADGTYASESAMTCAQTDNATSKDSRQLPSIKRLFLEGKFECSGVLVNALTKLIVRLETLGSPDLEAHRARALLIMTSTLRLGTSKYPASAIDQDSIERIAFAIQVLLAPPGDDGDLKRALTAESEAAFNAVMVEGGQHNGLPEGSIPAIDAVIDFGFVSAKPRHGSKKTSASKGLAASPSLFDLLSNDSGSKSPSTPQTELTAATGVAGSKLSKVVQLTGFSDPVYAETYVHVSGKEIYLDMLLVNQTEETLQGVSVELSCAGDLKLVEKPTPLTLPPFGFTTGKAVFRVTATNHGHIFGCISFLSGATGLDAETVILGEVRIDVLEYIHAASIEEPSFRDAWVLLEWENKISIKVPMRKLGCWDGGLRGFLGYIADAGHLTPITPNAGQDGPEATFLACNLYAKSIFDEEILANVCLECQGSAESESERDTGSSSSWITGHLRLRSRTQGLAIAFGDKLNALIHSK